jgi:hypothetical protein
MEEQIKKTIGIVLSLITNNKSAGDILHLTQAALNLANAVERLKESK